MKAIPISISWSGGKDSAYMLYKILNDPIYEVIELHTTISSQNHRVSMHGISRELMQAQADAIGLPITFISVAPSMTNAAYETALSSYYKTLAQNHIHHVGFGDIFLEDLKNYREKLLSNNSISGVYPIWGLDTKDIVNNFLQLGFKTKICCVNKSIFQKPISGQDLSLSLIEEFPKEVDPCGENGEFHTFTYQGPIFQRELSIRSISTLERAYSIDSNAKSVVFDFSEIVINYK